MDCLDAHAFISRPDLLDQARDIVNKAAGLFREWKFAQAHQLLDKLRRLANT
jgi:hypothetical protein